MTIEQRYFILVLVFFPIKLIVGYEFRVSRFYSARVLRILFLLFTQVSIRALDLSFSIQVFLFVFISIACFLQLFIINLFVNIDLIMFALTMSE